MNINKESLENTSDVLQLDVKEKNDIESKNPDSSGGVAKEKVEKEKDSSKLPKLNVIIKKIRRIRVGDKQEEIYNWPLSEFENLDSPCALQEYLQDLLRSNENVDPLKLPDNQAEDIWLYEHLSYLVVQLIPECNAETCKDMKANEWFYLCASHTTPRACCAIDYIVHTLDGATQLLNSPKFFPSRISVPSSSIKHFMSIARRLYRIFAHSFYHHRSVFDTFEHQYKLYDRFLQLVTTYSLVPESLITIPDLVSTSDYLNVNTNPRLNFANIGLSETDADVELETENEKGSTASDETSQFVPLVRPANSKRYGRR